MNSKFVAAAFAAVLSTGISMPAAASLIDVTAIFSSATGRTLANVQFTYDSSKTGVLSYSDLTAFDAAFKNSAGLHDYDLAFVTQAASAYAGASSGNYLYFGYDTTSQSFVAAQVDDNPPDSAYAAAILSTFHDGFYIGSPADGSDIGAGDFYHPENIGTTYSTVRITSTPEGAVPEPATWAMMLGGFGAIGGAMRSRRKAAVSFG